MKPSTSWATSAAPELSIGIRFLQENRQVITDAVPLKELMLFRLAHKLRRYLRECNGIALSASKKT